MISSLLGNNVVYGYDGRSLLWLPSLGEYQKLKALFTPASTVPISESSIPTTSSSSSTVLRGKAKKKAAREARTEKEAPLSHLSSSLSSVSTKEGKEELEETPLLRCAFDVTPTGEAYTKSVSSPSGASREITLKRVTWKNTKPVLQVLTLLLGYLFVTYSHA